MNKLYHSYEKNPEQAASHTNISIIGHGKCYLFDCLWFPTHLDQVHKQHFMLKQTARSLQAQLLY